jgi:hypothetical protein
LIEAKSYPADLYGDGCAARATRSRQLIEAALEQTQRWLGLAPEAKRWTGRLYQTANRLAHLYFLREVAGVEAWLAHLCFVDDQSHIQAGETQWRHALAAAGRELGLVTHSPYSASVLFPAQPRGALLSSA